MKSNSISGLEQKRIRTRTIVRFDVCSADQMPSPWRFARVNAGLARRNGYRSGRHAQPGSRAARKRELLVDGGHVWKARDETDNIDTIAAPRVKRNHVRLSDPGARGNVGQVGPELAAITDLH